MKGTEFINIPTNGIMQFIETAATPEDALGFAVQKARGAEAAIRRALEEILN